MEIQELLTNIEKEIASIKDVQKREQERQKIKNLWARYRGDDEVTTMDEVVKADKERSQGLRNYGCGPGLGEMLVNFRDTELVTISGPTKNGKTTFAMYLTKRFIEQEAKPCWFSYEMTPEEFSEKMGDSPLPLIYTPRSLKTNSVEWLENKIVEAIAKYDANIFFIDHLHFVCDISGKPNENLSSRIGRAMRELKTMAVKWNVCIFLVAHTTKIRATEDPTVASLRDSSFIAQESNTVLYVRRMGTEQEYTNETEVFVIANRRTGQNGSAKFKYDYENLDLEYVPPDK
jgi:replicative DNA helicase